ncbi:MAG: FHA domain-containing protein [Hyphomicrobiales bacterium]
MEYGTLRVQTPDGQIREYPIEVPTVVVGRAEGNGVVIDHVTVSRRHAQLRIEDGKLFIEDLGSATGTFVAGERVNPGSQRLCEDGESIRFGDVDARFLVPVAAIGNDFSPNAPVNIATSDPTDTKATVAVSLASPSAPVAAGATTTASVVVQNRGQVVDQLSISVPDVPESWIRLSRDTLTLVPGAKDEVTVIIQPPRTAEAVAGEYDFSVAVVSREHSREVRVLGKFTILPFDNFSMSVQPARSTRSFRLQAENLGNAPVTYALEGMDDEAALEYEFERDVLQLNPGARETVPFEVSTKKRRLFGKVETRPFKVQGRPQNGRSIVADGHLAIRPPLRHWKWPVAAIIILAALFGGWWGYSKKCGDDGWSICSSGGDDGQQPANPDDTATAPPNSATNPDATLHNGGTAIIVNSPEGRCLFVREFHTRRPEDPRSKILGQLCDGAKVTLTSESVEDEGYLWWSVDDGKGLKGWAAEKPLTGEEVYMVPSE